jgi:NADH:ubiquinone oxidoreductase subunit 5 (subunit L)/multisubunit Na+/H+ antiporter MnhA subunit
MPAASAFFAIAALSLVGMPPFFGFFTKLRILEAAAAAHSGIGYAGIVVILFATVIESIYLFRIVRTLYGANAEAAVSSSAGGDLPVFAWIAVAGFVLLVLVGGFIIPSFDRLLQPMAAVLATI